jgi:3-oxoacyl-[acyl-carrier-protein] synthase-3
VQAEKGVTTASLAAGAARAAIAASGADSSGIEMIIVATTTPDVLWPSTACLVQTDLQLPMVAAFDLYGAQAGMLTALNVAIHFLAAGLKNILLIGAECDRQLVDLPGQGSLVHTRAASAVVLNRGEGKGGILATVSGGAARSTAELDGGNLLANGIASAAHECLERSQLSIDNIDLVIGDHSAPDVTETWARKERIPSNKLMLEPQRFGPLLAAGPFITLHEAVKGGRLQDGMTVLLLESGAGPVWAAACIRWAGSETREW